MKLRDIIAGKPPASERIKVFIVDGYSVWGKRMYEAWVRSDPYMDLTDNPEEADALVFMGGADISPSIYHQPVHNRTTGISPNRDRYEIAMALMSMDKLKVGVCRGAQLLNCMSGGSLIQHVEGHASGRHDLKLISEGGLIMRSVPSTHHQMMLPSPDMASRKILAVAYDEKNDRDWISNINQKHVPDVMVKEKMPFLNKYRSRDFNPFTQEAEIIYYNSTNSLCIQSHPEKPMCPSNFTAYCNNLIVTLAKRTTKQRERAIAAHGQGELICVDT